MTNKEKYREYCRKHAVDLYANDWWLDGVCGDHWDVVERNGVWLAFPFKKKYGLKLMTQPKLTLGLAPASAPSSQQPNLDQLISQLPPFDLLDLYFLPQIKQGTFDKGFKVQTRSTYRITDLSDTKKVFANFDPSTRQQIRKAEKKVSVSKSEDISLLYKMVSLTFKRQSRKTPYSLEYVRKLNDACLEHKCRTILVAKDEEDNIHGACFIAWDNETAYYVMGGSDPKFKSSAAYSLLMWEVIKEASKHSRQFDFCGSMIASIARFFKGFGAQETSYLHLKKVNSAALGFLLKLRQA